jgi:hypothetical protein
MTSSEKPDVATESNRCAVCKKLKPTPLVCDVCHRAGIAVALCSALCKDRHKRDGRHRKLLKEERSRER